MSEPGEDFDREMLRQVKGGTGVAAPPTGDPTGHATEDCPQGYVDAQDTYRHGCAPPTGDPEPCETCGEPSAGRFGTDDTPLCLRHLVEANTNYEAAVRDAPPTGDREWATMPKGERPQDDPEIWERGGAAPPTGDRERPDHFCGPACEASGHAGVVRERPDRAPLPDYEAAPPTGDRPTDVEGVARQATKPSLRSEAVGGRDDPAPAAPPTGDRESNLMERIMDGRDAQVAAERAGERCPKCRRPPNSRGTIEDQDRGTYRDCDWPGHDVDALVADKAASDDVIEALAARIAELERELTEARNVVAAERVRGDRLEAALTIMHRSYHGEALTDCLCSRALAADPEGGPTDG